MAKKAKPGLQLSPSGFFQIFAQCLDAGAPSVMAFNSLRKYAELPFDVGTRERFFALDLDLQDPTGLIAEVKSVPLQIFLRLLAAGASASSSPAESLKDYAKILRARERVRRTDPPTVDYLFELGVFIRFGYSVQDFYDHFAGYEPKPKMLIGRSRISRPQIATEERMTFISAMIDEMSQQLKFGQTEFRVGMMVLHEIGGNLAELMDFIRGEG